MYIGDRHINFDRYYDASDYDDDPETEEEIAAAEAEAAAERAEWKAAEEKWKAAESKCKCGRTISLVDFFYDGICSACISESMEQFFAQGTEDYGLLHDDHEAYD